jgi:hypothetical protein
MLRSPNQVVVKSLQKPAYLPGTGATVILQAVPPGRGPSIAHRLG